MRAFIAYSLVCLAKRIYPPLLSEMVRMVVEEIVDGSRRA